MDDTLARIQTLLSVDDDTLATLLGAPKQALHDDAPPPTSVLRRGARLLGLSVRELMAGAESPLQVLYRGAAEDESVLAELAEDDLACRVGEFVHDLTHASRLRPPPSPLPDWADHRPLPSDLEPHRQGRALADEVRARLDLGHDPIPSAWALLEGLGVVTSCAPPDLLPPAIDGLSWRTDAIAGIVMNPVYGLQTWWRTRMTLAHELCHLLFDLPARGLILSSRRRRDPLYRHFQTLEQRANAFAAYLLLPPEGVMHVVAGRGPTPEAILDVVRHFQVGVDTAVHITCDLHHAPKEGRRELAEDVSSGLPGRPDHPDAHGRPTPREHLETAVRTALQDGRITRVQAYLELGLRLDRPLPLGVPDRSPAVSSAARIRAEAERILQATGRTRWAPDRVVLREDGDYEVRLGPRFRTTEASPEPEPLVVTRSSLAT